MPVRQISLVRTRSGGPTKNLATQSLEIVASTPVRETYSKGREEMSVYIQGFLVHSGWQGRVETLG